MLNQRVLKLLIACTVLINCVAIIFSVIPDHDPALYATIAKQMALSNEWINLLFNNIDWLDKPHVIFWITALSFKLFGISSFTYIFPGFLFNLLGAYYTYLLARYLYNQEIALLAALIYLTAFHLMWSTIDVRAEVYLLGEIMPAVYYWLRYHDNPGINLQYVMLGSLFTALAVMTKGIFVLVTVFGGVTGLALYQLVTKRQLGVGDKPKVAPLLLKWGVAGLLTSLFITPELISLYLQFDLHPEKVVFNNTHVSGIKWFFWDSQLGRFFNTGPINGHASALHYVFFVPTFLWAFLPWSFFFIAALCWILHSKATLTNSKATSYLLGAFLPTFIMFSLSSFQLEHYTNIIIPFAAILTASWVYQMAERQVTITINRMFLGQIFFAAAIISLIVILDRASFNLISLKPMALSVLALGVGFLLARQSFLSQSIVYSTVAINLGFIYFMTLNMQNYRDYDVGYKSVAYLKQLQPLPIVAFQDTLFTLTFHAQDPVITIQTTAQLSAHKKPYYLVVNTGLLVAVKPYLGAYEILTETTGLNCINNPIKVALKTFSKSGIDPQLMHYSLVRVNSA